jgi:energy-coupling factor transport system ATP-binding protein
VDVDAILDRVGLAALADRDTTTLSGGELQRLALGAALARAPKLLLSDEATSMVDPGGRERIVALLRDAADDGVAVVHVTHRPEETLVADRVVTLAHGRVAATPAAAPELPVLPPAAPVPTDAGPLLALRGVGHVYAQGTPWACRALADVDLELYAGEGLLVLGHNGSGKSTLAWVLAGLLRPSEGDALLEGEPLHERVGHVALAFQHARLQLLRSTVGGDVAAASGADEATVAATLELVGLDPAAFVSRRVDELSGGETRRVALAGMLARSPRVLVLDEPFAGLDAAGRASLASLLVRLREVDGMTVVIVSHDPELTPHLVDQVLTLDGGRVVPRAAVRSAP